MTHEEYLGATRHLPAGQLVVDTTRMPTIWQPWLHAIYVGVIEEPGDDIAAWNGTNSERTYCETCGYIPVRYDFGCQLSTITYLVPITEEEAALTPLQKVRHFLGEEAEQNWLKTTHTSNPQPLY